MEAQILDIKGSTAATDVPPQELFIRQVADVSVPAPVVLVEQRASSRPELPAPLFVP